MKNVSLEKTLGATIYDIDKMRRVSKVAFNSAMDYVDPFHKVGFDFDGQWISDPWLDSTARFDFTDEEMVEEYGVENLKAYLEAVRKVTEVIIDYRGYTPSTDELNILESNFIENYPEYAKYMEKSDSQMEIKGGFLIRWEGFFPEGTLTDENIQELIRLTHHAEGFYEDTEIEHTHVEVFIDGIWYGKA